MLEIARELALLRRGDHEAERLRREQECWEAEKAEVSEKKKSEENLSPLYSFLLAHQVAMLHNSNKSINLLPDLVEALAQSSENRP